MNVLDLLLAGLLISLSGMMVAIFAFTSSAFDNFPEMRNAFVIIGLIFAFIGIGVRLWGLKMQRKHKK